jgi:hypothetical protein
MSVTLKEVFDACFEYIEFDKDLVKRIYKYQIGYVNQSNEYLDFYGGNLLGVHAIRFKDSDISRFFDDVIDVDYLELQASLKYVTTINHNFKISSDAFNLTTMYIMHRLLNAKLDPKLIQAGIYDTALIFFYRCIAALISDYFRYPAEKKISQAAYAALTNKFLIKKLGSWHKFMDYRANELIDPKGLHLKALHTFDKDDKIVYAINDSQGRIRDVVKSYYSKIVEVRDNKSWTETTSSTIIDVDGEVVLKDRTTSADSYITYLRNIIIDKPSFINAEMVAVIAGMGNMVTGSLINETLKWMSDNYRVKEHHDLIDEFITKTIMHSLYLIIYNMNTKHKKDYAYILNSLKFLYLSTRSRDPDLEIVRDLGYQVMDKATKKNISKHMKVSLRLSIVLYITLRVLVKDTI